MENLRGQLYMQCPIELKDNSSMPWSEMGFQTLDIEYYEDCQILCIDIVA